MSHYSALRLTPMLPVRDPDAAAAFFARMLGFRMKFRRPGYAYLTLGNAALRFIQAGPDMDMSDERRQVSVYLDVDGIDAYWQACRPALSGLPPGRVKAPFDQDYGQREFHVIYESILVFVGEAIQPAETETTEGP